MKYRNGGMKSGNILPFYLQPAQAVRDQVSVAANVPRLPRQLAETKKDDISRHSATGSRGLVCSRRPLALSDVALPESERTVHESLPIWYRNWLPKIQSCYLQFADTRPALLPCSCHVVRHASRYSPPECIKVAVAENLKRGWEKRNCRIAPSSPQTRALNQCFVHLPRSLG